ncbi:unnamed protein product [Umbelopsis ramanniana]
MDNQIKKWFLAVLPRWCSPKRIRRHIDEGTFKGKVNSVWGMDQGIQAYDKFNGPDAARERGVIDSQHNGLHAGANN